MNRTLKLIVAWILTSVAAYAAMGRNEYGAVVLLSVLGVFVGALITVRRARLSQRTATRGEAMMGGFLAGVLVPALVVLGVTGSGHAAAEAAGYSITVALLSMYIAASMQTVDPDVAARAKTVGSIEGKPAEKTAN